METAVTQTDSASVVEIPKGADYANWRKTGSLKTEPVVETPKADPTPALSAETEKSAEEIASASEAESVQERPKPKRSNADSRLTEILKDLRDAGLTPAELKTFRKQAEQQTKADPSPVAAEPKKAEGPKKPKIEDFDTWDKYEAAKDKYYEDLADFKAQSAIQKSDADRAAREQQRTLQEKLTEARKRYSDYDIVAQPVLDAVFGKTSTVHPAVQAIVDASPVFTDLLYVIGGNEADMRDFLQTAKSDPIAAIRKTVLLERLVMEELAGEGEKHTVPEKKVTGAPPPGREVTGKTGPPPDPVASAAEKGDMRAYREAANRRDLLKRKGR